jgi:pyrophosphatase PpaX
MPITTVLFDVDGTLLDTSEFILGAFEHALAHHGLPPMPRDTMLQRIGEPLEEIYNSLSIGGSPSFAELVETHRTFQAANLHLSVPFPDTVATLARLKDAGFALAAVTSRSRRTSLDTLEQSGLLDYLAVVVSAEDAAALKPHPAPLLQALAQLGRDPGEAAMVGDTPHDIAAGRAAGMRTIGALYGFRGEAAMRAACADALIAQVGDIVPVLGAWA